MSNSAGRDLSESLNSSGFGLQLSSSAVMDPSSLVDSGDSSSSSPPSKSSSPSEKATGRLYAVSLLIALSSFLYGIVTTSLNGTFAKVSNTKGSIFFDIPLDTNWQEFATTATIAGAWLGCSLSGFPSHRFGLRATLIFNNIFYIAGAAVCALATTKYTLSVGRFVSGFGEYEQQQC
jgi:hypothetical protein